MMIERELRPADSESPRWLTFERVVLGGIVTALVPLSLYALLWAGRSEEHLLATDAQLLALDRRIEQMEIQTQRLSVMELQMKNIESSQLDQNRRIDALEANIRQSSDTSARMDERLKTAVTKLDDIVSALRIYDKQRWHNNNNPYPN